MLRTAGWLSNGICAVVLACGLMFGAAAAQNYETLPIAERYQMPTLTGRETPQERAQLNPRIAQAKAGIGEDLGAIQDNLKTNSARSENFDRYFQEYVFAEMTQTGDEYLSTLGNKRSDFLRKYLSPDYNGENRRYLIEQVMLPTMKRVAEGNFHPAARLNAVLMVGIANSTEASSTSGEAPQPNPACVTYLLSLLKQDQLPLYLRVGAFTGLHRVAQIEGLRPRLEENSRKEIATAAVAVAEGKAAGQDQWDPDANYWLRRRAVQILGFLRDPGENLAVVNVLYGIMADEKNQFLLRLDAIDSLSRLNVTEAASARVKDVAEGVTKFAGEAMQKQADKIRLDIEDYMAVNLLNKGPFLLRTGAAPSSSGGSGGRDTPSSNAGGGLDGGNDEPAGGSSQAGKDPNAPVFDMPNYYLNAERRACKNYVFVCQNLFSKNGKWYSFAADSERGLIDNANRLLDDVMDKSDVGLVDLGKSDSGKKSGTDAREELANKDEEGPSKGAAMEMIRLFETTGKKLKDLVTAQPKPAGENAAPAGN